MAFVAKYKNKAFDTGHEKRPMYVNADGKATDQIGQARRFETEQEMNSFLHQLPGVTEGVVPEVEMVPA
jgi:hypothetical protein